MIERAIDFLVGDQSPDGGWGVEKGRLSNTEASAFSLLGLTSLGDQALAESINRELDWLTNQQNADGSWPLTGQPNFLSLAIFEFETQDQRALRGATTIPSGLSGRFDYYLFYLIGVLDD